MIPRPKPSPRRAAAVLATLLALSAAARADGQSDLRAALGRLAGQTPVAADLEVETRSRHGEGKDATEKTGQVRLRLEESTRGLQVTYALDTLARLDAEARAKAKDPEAKTPTGRALQGLDATDLQPLVSAAADLQRRLDEAQFKGERAQTWQGRPARVVSFSVPQTRLSAEDRKYVRQFDSTLEIWIGADGTPLASATHTNVAGRAMVVISFESHEETQTAYAVLGDRLVATRRETHSVNSGAGEHGEQHAVLTLTPDAAAAH